MVVFGSVWSDLLVLHKYCVIISESQKVTCVGVKTKKCCQKIEKNKVAGHCLIWREIFLEMFFEIFDNFFFF